MSSTASVVPFAGLPRPLLFAHRGASRVAPENTLEAFDMAARLGAQVLEMDVHATADGEVVVLHDAALNRTTDGSGPVRAIPYAQLAQLDAGCKFRTAHGASPFKGRGVVVPRLEDVLRSFPRMAFNIEIKAADPRLIRQVLDLFARVGVSAQQVVLAAGVDSVMALLEAAKPGIPLGMSARQAWRTVRGSYLGRVPEGLAGRALQIPPSFRGLSLATSRVVARTRACGIPVHVWTLNHPRLARKYLERGVDGVMSDDPGALSDLFAQYRGAVAARSAAS